MTYVPEVVTVVVTLPPVASPEVEALVLRQLLLAPAWIWEIRIGIYG